jgi:hypothetical protein
MVDVQDEDSSDIVKSKPHMIASDPTQIALLFCIMADLDNNNMMPAIDGLGNLFYTGPYIFFDSLAGVPATCESFLPDIFNKLPINRKEGERKRNFGASSSSVDR